MFQQPQVRGHRYGSEITKSLVKLIQGEVGVDGIPNHGSTFWFTALLQPGRGEIPSAYLEKLTNAETQLSALGHDIHILLVEDNPINLEVAKEILENVGLMVDCAENGRVAIEKVRNNGCQLVLMVVQMPEMDGLVATRAIRQIVGKQDLPILAMTANAFEEDKSACFYAGMKISPLNR